MFNSGANNRRTKGRFDRTKNLQIEACEERRMLAVGPFSAVPLGETDYELMTVDIDNDHDVDVIGIGNSSIAWQQNQDGNFAPPEHLIPNAFSSPLYRPNVVAEDLDSDGDNDLISSSGNNLRWHEQVFRSHRRFRTRQLAEFPAPVLSIATADFNGDKQTDILVTSSNPNPIQTTRVVHWLKNLGDGRFDSPQFAFLTTAVRPLLPVDLNNDGNADLVTQNGRQIIWYENQGAGQFSERTIYDPDELTGPVRILTIADVDDDSFPDLVVSHDAQLRLLSLKEGGNLVSSVLIWESHGSSVPEAVDVVDFDRDGDLDLAYFGSEFGWFENDEMTWRLHPPLYTVSSSELERLFGLFDIPNDGFRIKREVRDSPWPYADRHYDLLQISADGELQQVQPVMNAQFGFAPPIEARDADNDGDLDIVGSRGYYEIEPIVGWTGQLVSTTESRPYESLGKADLSGDGIDDAVRLIKADGQVVWTDGNDGASHVILDAVSRVLDVAVTDLNGDGTLDIGLYYQTRSDGSYRVAWYSNDGHGSFEAHQLLPGEQGIQQIAFHDISGDGIPDLAYAKGRYRSSEFEWRENDGTGTFSEPREIIRVERTRGASFGLDDVDGDGDTDLLLARSSGSETISLYRRSESQFASEPEIILSTTDPVDSSRIELYDIDEDGDSDIIVSFGCCGIDARTEQSVVYWLENQAGTFVEVSRTVVYDTLEDFVYADFDQDGDIDIASPTDGLRYWAILFRNDSEPAQRGDFNRDNQINTIDINAIYAALPISNDPKFDLNNDGVLNEADVDVLIEEILNTSYGDANLDGVFNSTDLILVFQRAEYEDDVRNNSVWESGDWNGDGEFTSDDFIFVFQRGRYEKNAVSTDLVKNRSDVIAFVDSADGRFTKRARRHS